MKRISYAILLVALSLFLLPLPASTERNDEETYRHLDLFGTVFERVRTSYVEEVTDKQLIEAAINGMLQSLDPHSSYLSPDDFREMQVRTRGKFGGLGIEVTMEDGVVKVVAPIDDTPAAEAGIQAGDLITHVDGKPILGMNLREAVTLMRGPVGSKVTLTVRRAEEAPFDVEITRAIIRVRSVRHRTESDGTIGYVRVTSFSEQTAEGVRNALMSFQEEMGDKWIGVVLDLRNNPGGLLGQSVSVADAFLERGEIVSTRGRDERIDGRHSATEGDLANGLPVVVLINGGSASASEIVAGALQDHRRAIIMGTQSFGKGSVQVIIPLGNQGAMRLTTARYYTPSGRSIQAKGVTPDIVVPQAKLEVVDNRRRRREQDLRGALDTDNGETESQTNGEEGVETDQETEQQDSRPGEGEQEQKDAEAAKQTTAARQDYQLTRAIDLLRALALVRAQQKASE